MNLWNRKKEAIGAINRGDACESGLCTRCVNYCKGKCEVWLSCLRGREIVYPKGFGHMTAGSANTSPIGVGYHSLRINGNLFGSSLGPNPDNAIFPKASLRTSFGKTIEVKCDSPIITGALGSTKIAKLYWDTFAYAAALCGFPIVIGENVVGMDLEAVFENGKIVKVQELDRRIHSYIKYYNGKGCLFVQMNVEDTRNGVAEYLIENYGKWIEKGIIIIELKWGQGAKAIGGETTSKDIDYARFLKNGRGYIVDPDPDIPVVVTAYENGAISGFTRHSRLGFTECFSKNSVKENFAKEVTRLRKMGFKGISLKTGAYNEIALTLAMEVSSDNNIDLLTIDGAGGGTGQSPWNMMEHWGVPSLHLHAAAYQIAKIMEDSNLPIPDMALGGGLSRGDHIYKILAIAGPYSKLALLGRAIMVGGFLGNNIAGTYDEEIRKKVNGQWDELPGNVTKYGTLPRQILSGYAKVEEIIGKKDMKTFPLGVVCIFNYVDKLSCEVQQFMAGLRKFDVSLISRDDLMSANQETADCTKIPLMGSQMEEVRNIIMSRDF